MWVRLTEQGGKFHTLGELRKQSGGCVAMKNVLDLNHTPPVLKDQLLLQLSWEESF